MPSLRPSTMPRLRHLSPRHIQEIDSCRIPIAPRRQLWLKLATGAHSCSAEGWNVAPVPSGGVIATAQGSSDLLRRDRRRHTLELRGLLGFCRTEKCATIDPN